MRPLRVIPLILTLAICCYADTIVAPDNFYIGNRLPFGQNGTVLYEQVYSSSLFSGPMDITALSFFIATYAGPNTGFADGLYYVGLSTTSKPVGGLDSTNLLSNIGTDNGLFFLGELNGGSTIDGNPFYYDPSKGNLLMTLAVTGNEPDCDLTDGALSCGSQGIMWRAAEGTGTSRAWYTPDLVPYGFSLSGSDDVGLATEFTYSAVPEPSSLILLGTVVPLVVLTFRKR